MKNIKNLIVIGIITGVFIVTMLHTLPIYAEDNGLIKKRATAYCLQGKTCTGAEVREGIVASSDKSMIGKTIIMYQRLPGDEVGKVIGIYEVLDTGAMSTSVMDVWQQNLEKCQEFMNLVYEDGCQGKVFIQILDAEG